MERMVRDKVAMGEIDWFPDGRCISAETGEDDVRILACCALRMLMSMGAGEPQPLHSKFARVLAAGRGNAAKD